MKFKEIQAQFKYSTANKEIVNYFIFALKCNVTLHTL